jgi:hypothetical protein
MTSIVKIGTSYGQRFAIFDCGPNRKDGHCRKRYYIARLDSLGGRNALRRSNELSYIKERFNELCDNTWKHIV